MLVDEVHGAAQASGQKGGKSTATAARTAPENRGKCEPSPSAADGHAPQRQEEGFLSILSLLRPEFAHLDLSHLTEDKRTELARHFVQRRRADVKKWMGEETPFPERDDKDTEQAYKFSKAFRGFYNEVYEFARDLVRSRKL